MLNLQKHEIHSMQLGTLRFVVFLESIFGSF